MSASYYKKGFSLLELTIISCIIGLLIAGIISGISLVKNAKLKHVMTEQTSLFQAISLFQDKYSAYPGDMTNAYDIWGASCDAVASNCNGNGDNHIVFSTSSLVKNEALRAWQHLQLAGMIMGSFSGVGTTLGQADIGVNVPKSLFDASGWGLNFNSAYSAPNSEGQYLEIGGFNPNNPADASILTPLEAQNIDAKTDDGLPRNGLVFGYGASGATGCYSALSLSAIYNVGVKNKTCGLRFVLNKY